MQPTAARAGSTCAHGAACRGHINASAARSTLFHAKPARAARGLRLTTKAAEGSGGEVCDVADIESCTLADLELMYVDALWSFYHPDTKGQFTLSDEDFDRLKDELNWQGSGFPTLHREEIEFVEASIAYARGQPVVSDEQYDVLKRSVRRRGEDRKDVTALLLYTKGVQLLDPDQYEQLRDEMTKLGIEVGLKGATCTLSKTSEELKMDMESILRMYTGLGFAPTVIGFATTIILGLPFHGFHPTVTSQSAVVSIAIGVALTTILANYLELHNTEILIGDCPCCETPIKQLFAGKEKANSVDQKCPVCGTLSTMDRTTRKISLASGPDFISA